MFYPFASTFHSQSANLQLLNREAASWVTICKKHPDTLSQCTALKAKQFTDISKGMFELHTLNMPKH